MEFWRSNFFRWHRENTPCRPYSLQTSRFILLVTPVNLCEPLDMPSHFLSHGVWSSLPSHFMIAIDPMVHVDHVVHLLSCSLFELSEFTTTTLFGGQQTQTVPANKKNLLHPVAGAFASSGNMWFLPSWIKAQNGTWPSQCFLLLIFSWFSCHKSHGHQQASNFSKPRWAMKSRNKSWMTLVLGWESIGYCWHFRWWVVEMVAATASCFH